MFCIYCFADNSYANFCFTCAPAVSANLKIISYDRKVDSLGGAACGEILKQLGKKGFIVPKRKTEVSSDARLKMILLFISVEFAALLIINNLYNLFNLINLYRS